MARSVMQTPFVFGVFAPDHRPDPVHRRDLSPCRQQDDAIVTAISDLMQAPRCATTKDKAEICTGLKAGTRHSISAVRRGRDALDAHRLMRTDQVARRAQVIRICCCVRLGGS